MQRTYGHHSGGIRAVDAAPDGLHLVSNGDDVGIRVWEAASGAQSVTFSGHNDVVNAVAISSAPPLAASGSGSPPPNTVDPSVRLWDATTGAELHVLFGHAGGTTAVDLAPHAARVASGGRDSRVRLWSTATGGLQETLLQPGTVQRLAYSPDGALLAVAVGSDVRVYSTSDLTLLRTLPDTAHVAALAWSPDRKLATALEAIGDNARIWDVVAGTVLRTLPGDPVSFLQGVAFAPDGRTLATSSGYTGTIRTWFVESGALLRLYDEETGTSGNPSLPLAPLPDGGLFYGRTDPTVVLSACSGTSTPYGAGCAGSGGLVPVLDVGGCPTAGGTLTVQVSNALGGSIAVVGLGTAQGVLPLLGCTLLVEPLQPTLTLLSLVGTGPGAGSAQLVVPLPPTPPPPTVTLQAYVRDPAGPQGFAATNGVELDFGS